MLPPIGGSVAVVRRAVHIQCTRVIVVYASCERAGDTSGEWGRDCREAVLALEPVIGTSVDHLALICRGRGRGISASCVRPWTKREESRRPRRGQAAELADRAWLCPPAEV